MSPPALVELVHKNTTVGDDQTDTCGVADVDQWVASDGNDVGESAGSDPAESVLQAQICGGIGRGGGQGVSGFESDGHEPFHLSMQRATKQSTGVGSSAAGDESNAHLM